MKALILTALLVPIFVLAGVASAANWITTGGFSHVNNDDVIVFPGQPGASHNHTYVGARDNNAFSTFQSMQAGGTTFRTSGDFSGAWVPTGPYPIHSNKGFLLYYSVTASTRVFPDGLKMIVRWSHNRIRFKCGPGSNTETLAPPASCSSGMLVWVVEFPQWSDGRTDSSDHISHMSYSRTATHTILLPRIKLYARFAVPAGQLINLSLSSGDYQTAHVDYFDAWDKTRLQQLINQCAGTNCGTDPA
jgi:hypothetical protein